MSTSETLSSPPEPPEDAYYEVSFTRLADRTIRFAVFVSSPFIEDAKTEALQKLGDLGQDPAHYDVENARIRPVNVYPKMI